MEEKKEKKKKEKFLGYENKMMLPADFSPNVQDAINRYRTKLKRGQATPASIASHIPGAIVITPSGSKYRVAEDGSWRRL